MNKRHKNRNHRLRNAYRHRVSQVEQLESRMLLAADIFEPNDTLAQAANLGTADQSHAKLTIEANNDDWYRFDTTVGGTLRVDILFQSVLGDLELELYNSKGVRVDFSDTVSDDETIIRQVSGNETFFIRVFGFGGATNTYQLNIDGPNLTFPQDALEPNDTLAQAAFIGTGDQTRANLTIHGPNNDDWFDWVSPANGPLTLDLLFSHATGNLDLEVFDKSGKRLASSNSVDDNENVQLAVTAGQELFFRVFGVSGDTHDNYSLQIDGPELVISPDSFEPNDTMLTAANLGTGDRTAKSLTIHESGNDDYYQWTAPKDGDVVFSVLFGHAFGNIDLRVFDTNGNLLIDSLTETDNETVKLPATQGQTFIVQVLGDKGARHPSYDISIDGPNILPDALEPNDTFSTAFDLGTGDQTRDELSIHASGNSDFFKITPTDSGPLTVDLEFVHNVGNLDLELLDGSNRVIASSRSLTDNEHVSIEVTAGQKIVIRVFGVGGDLQADYRLMVDGPVQATDRFEINDSFATAADLGTGDQSQKGLTLHERFDADWFKWTAVQDGDVEVSIFFNGALGDLDLELYDINQNLLDESTTVTDSETVSTFASEGDMLFIHVFGFGDAVQRDYELVIDGPGPGTDSREPNDTMDQASDIGVGDTSIMGTIHFAGNDDWYKWTALAQGNVNIDLLFDHAEGNVDLDVFDVDGNLLQSPTSTDDNETATVTVDADQMLLFRVRGVDNALQESYELIVDGNDRPTISDLADQSSNEDNGIAVAITVSDDQTALADLQLDVSSSDESVVPNQTTNLVVSGDNSIRTLNVIPLPNASGTTTITITVTDGAGAVSTASFNYTVLAVADAPNLALTDASGREDTAISLDIAASLVDTDGSETLSVTLSGLPPGATLSAGQVQNDGSYRLAPADLAGLSITPAAQDDSDFTISVTATATEITSGDFAETSGTLNVNVSPVVDPPSLKVTEMVTGNEDSAIPLTISASTLDTDATIEVTVAGVPNGATLSAGIDNSDGSWTLSPDDLVDLTVTPGPDDDADFVLTVTATSTSMTDGSQAEDSADIVVTVEGQNDPPVHTVPGAQSTAENVPLTFSSSNANAISVSDVDAGAESIGVVIVVNDGTLTVPTPAAGVIVDGDASAALTLSGPLDSINSTLDGLTYTPDADFTGADTLTIITDDLGNNGAGGQLTATDTIEITVTDATGPTVQIADVSPEIRAGSVSEVTIAFSEPVSGFGLNNLALTRSTDGTLNVSLNSATLTSTDSMTWTLGNLGGLTGDSGIYQLSLANGNITDSTGNALANVDSSRWINGPGDANQDNQFDQRDVIAVLQGALYLTLLPASWSTGDFNGDGVFDQRDVIVALMPAHYLLGPFAAETQAGTVDSVAPESDIGQSIAIQADPPAEASVQHVQPEEVVANTAIPATGNQLSTSEFNLVDLALEDDILQPI